MADPKVGPVFAAWDDVTIQITPTSVIAWDMRQADRQFFGGAMEANPKYLFTAIVLNSAILRLKHRGLEGAVPGLFSWMINNSGAVLSEAAEHDDVGIVVAGARNCEFLAVLRP